MKKFVLVLAAALSLGATYRSRNLPPFDPTLPTRAPVITAAGDVGWRYGQGGTIDVRDYGAVPDDGLDDTTAINDAIAAAADVGSGTQSPGYQVYVPLGTYELTSTIRLSRGVRLRGDGPFASVLRFSPGKTGIVVEYYNTGASLTGNGANATIEHLGLEPTANATAWQSAHAYSVGAIVRSTTNLKDGLVFRCTTAGTSSAIIEPTMPAYGSTVSDGTAVWTADWSAGIWLKASATVEDVAIGSVTTAFGFAGHGFQVYASTVFTPPTNANGWRASRLLITGSRGDGVFAQGADANRGHLSSSTFAANSGWGVDDQSFLGNTYEDNIAQTNGTGGYSSTNANARTTFVDCYSEGDEPASRVIYPAMVLGGLYANGFTDASTGGRFVNGVFAGAVASRQGNSSEGFIRLDLNSGDPTDDETLLGFNAYNSAESLLTGTDLRFKYWRSQGLYRFDITNSSNTIPMLIGTGQSDAAIKSGEVLFPIGIGLGSPDLSIVDYPLLRSSTAPPSTGTYKAGDFYWNSAASSTVLGWRCTVAGTPGTWTSIGVNGNGPTGPTGATGNTGATGPNWTTCTAASNSFGPSEQTGACGDIVLSVGPTFTGAADNGFGISTTGGVSVSGTAAGIGAVIAGGGGAATAGQGATITGGAGGSVGGVGATITGGAGPTTSAVGAVIRGGNMSGSGTAGVGATITGGNNSSTSSGARGATITGGTSANNGIGGDGAVCVGGAPGGAGLGGDGVNATGGASTSGAGGDGVQGVGGASGGAGGRFTGGAVSGPGIVVTGTGTGEAITATGNMSISGTINSTTIPTSKTLVVTTDTVNVLASSSSANLRTLLSDESGTGAALFCANSAEVASAISDEIGTDKLIFSDAPTFTTVGGRVSVAGAAAGSGAMAITGLVGITSGAVTMVGVAGVSTPLLDVTAVGTASTAHALRATAPDGTSARAAVFQSDITSPAAATIYISPANANPINSCTPGADFFTCDGSAGCGSVIGLKMCSVSTPTYRRFAFTDTETFTGTTTAAAITFTGTITGSGTGANIVLPGRASAVPSLTINAGTLGAHGATITAGTGTATPGNGINVTGGAAAAVAVVGGKAISATGGLAGTSAAGGDGIASTGGSTATGVGGAGGNFTGGTPSGIGTGGNGVTALGGGPAITAAGIPGIGGFFTGGASATTGTNGGVGVKGIGGATGGTGVWGVGGTNGVGGWFQGTGTGASLVVNGTSSFDSTISASGAVNITNTATIDKATIGKSNNNQALTITPDSSGNGAISVVINAGQGNPTGSTPMQATAGRSVGAAGPAGIISTGGRGSSNGGSAFSGTGGVADSGTGGHVLTGTAGNAAVGTSGNGVNVTGGAGTATITSGNGTVGTGGAATTTGTGGIGSNGTGGTSATGIGGIGANGIGGAASGSGGTGGAGGSFTGGAMAITGFAGQGAVITGGAASATGATAGTGLTVTAGTASGGATAAIYALWVNGKTALSGSLKFLSGGIIGTTTNDDATALNVGEYVSASVVQGSALALTTATPKTITSISLTAGDWDVVAMGCSTGAATGTEFSVAIGTTTNSFTGTVLGDSRAELPTVSLTGADVCSDVPPVRASLSGTTTYYLVIQETFTVGTTSGYGRISARRMR